MTIKSLVLDNNKTLQQVMEASQGGFVFSEPFLHNTYAVNSNDIITHCDILFIIAPNEIYKCGFSIDRFDEHRSEIDYFMDIPATDWVKKSNKVNYFIADDVEKALTFIENNFKNMLTDAPFSDYNLCDEFRESLKNDFLEKDWARILRLHEAFNLKNSLESELPNNSAVIKKNKI